MVRVWGLRPKSAPFVIHTQTSAEYWQKRGVLVRSDQECTGFPHIPGVCYMGLYNRQVFVDYGSNLVRGRVELSPDGKPGGQVHG